MPKPKLTDAQFIALWHEHCSVVRIAKASGQTERNIASRRRSIESRHKIILPTIDPRHPSYNSIKPNESSTGAVARYRIDDGTIIVGSDAHIWPGPLTTMQRAFLRFAERLKPAAVVANGDFFDGAKQSRWPTIGWETKPTVRQELEAVADYMAELKKAGGRAKRFWPLGNHDARFETRIANSMPE